MSKKPRRYTPGVEDIERTLDILKKRRNKEKRDKFLREESGKGGGETNTRSNAGLTINETKKEEHK